jgi:hypothetical protein
MARLMLLSLHLSPPQSEKITFEFVKVNYSGTTVLVPGWVILKSAWIETGHAILFPG